MTRPCDGSVNSQRRQSVSMAPFTDVDRLTPLRVYRVTPLLLTCPALGLGAAQPNTSPTVIPRPCAQSIAASRRRPAGNT
jgi:hypothetical protein